MEAEPGRSNPHVFVVGCPRSGTTLLQRMLDGHRDLAVANDTHFVTRVLEKHARPQLASARSGDPVSLTPALLEGLHAYHRFPRLGLDASEVSACESGATTWQELVGRLYTTFARKAGKPLGGEKTPDFVKRLDLLHGLFPGARFVHIIRDGRDTTLSLLQWANEAKGPGRLDYWKEDPVAVSALWWRRMVEKGRRSGSLLGPDRYREVGYEALVAAPEEHLRDLCDFLEIPWDDGVLRYHEGRIKTQPGLSAKKAWLPPTRGLRDWHSELPAPDAELFEALTGDLLEALGLERAHPRPGQEAHARAAAARAWWDQNQRRRSGDAGRE